MAEYTTYDTIKILPCLSIFHEEELKSLIKHSDILEYQRKEILFQDGDRVRYVYILISGRIKLYKLSLNGREKVIRIMKEGDYFCCAPLFTAGLHIVNAIAIEDSEVLAIDADIFSDRVLGGLNESGKKIIVGLCNQILYLSKIIETLSFNDVEQRILITLRQVAEEESPDEDIVQLSLTHQDIASLVGTVREVVSRTMSRLKRKGIIVDSSVRGFRLDIKKLDRLLMDKSVFPYSKCTLL